MAAEYDLHPIFKREFHEMFEDEHEHPEFGPLMERMKVRDRDGASQMDEDQWEAASEFSPPLPYSYNSGGSSRSLCLLLLVLWTDGWKDGRADADE